MLRNRNPFVEFFQPPQLGRADYAAHAAIKPRPVVMGTERRWRHGRDFATAGRGLMPVGTPLGDRERELVDVSIGPRLTSYVASKPCLMGER